MGSGNESNMEQEKQPKQEQRVRIDTADGCAVSLTTTFLFCLFFSTESMGYSRLHELSTNVCWTYSDAAWAPALCSFPL